MDVQMSADSMAFQQEELLKRLLRTSNQRVLYQLRKTMMTPLVTPQVGQGGSGTLPPNPSQRSTPDTQTQLRSVLLHNQTFSQKSKSAPPTTSGLPTHDWTLGSGLVRGRTHVSWLFQNLEPLMVYTGRQTSSTKELQDDGTYSISINELLRPSTSMDSLSLTANDSIYDEVVSSETSYKLVVRYFETFDTIYPLVDRDAFANDYNAMMVDPKSVQIPFVLKVLIMQALANATYPPNEAPIGPNTISRWLSLANSFPSSILAVGELNIEIVRLFALLCLAEQVLKQDATTACLRSGGCIRAAMALGIHRVEDRPGYNYENARCVWEALVDLDLHACLAAGLPPNMPPAGSVESMSQTFEAMPTLPTEAMGVFLPETVPLVLSRSLPIRQKIVATYNSDKHLHFETVIKLGTELTKSLAPISMNTADGSPHAKTFQYRFLSFVYERFLATLHRPSATMDHPAFYLSRNMTMRLSKQYVKELIAVYQGKNNSDPFAALLVSQGVMFRHEALHAVTALCYEVYRGSDSGFGTHTASVLLGHADEKKEAEELIRVFLKIADENRLSEELYLIPRMTIAHVDAENRFEKESPGYVQAMVEAGREAEIRLSC